MDQPFMAAPHHDVLMFLVQVSILLLTARLLGELAQRLGQPTVVGEILAGIVLGPSLLSGLIPAIEEWIVPHNQVQGYLLEQISLLGVMFLLLITGLETDVALIRSQLRSAIGVALGGLLLPLVMGFALGQLLPADLLVASGDRLVFSLFIAIAMAISAIPVVAKVLMDLNLTRRDAGQTIIAAAMIDDTTGWILLSVVIGLASSGVVSAGSVFESVFTVIAFMVLSFTLGRWIVSRSLSFVQNQIQVRDKVLSFIVLLMFIWGAIGQALGLEALLGAFVIGIVLSLMPRLNPDIIHKLESIALGIFAPIFFATAGLKVEVSRLFEPRLLATTLIVIVVAVICKMVGVYVGARLIGRSDHWTAVFFGAGLNARGSIGIIVANIGLSLGILSQDMFSVIIVMAVVTSLMSPPVLRWAIAHIQPQQAEIERLRQEELKRANLIANVHRILLPVRVRDISSPSQLIEAAVLERLNANSEIALTLLTVTSSPEKAESSAFLEQLGQLFSTQPVAKKVLTGEPVTELILTEAKKDYDLMILGASESQRGSEVLFTPLVDSLMRLSPCPTMLVKGQRVQENWVPKRILVPSNGSQASQRAAEVAFALRSDGDEEVFILQVVEENLSDYHLDASGTLVTRQKEIAHQSVELLREMGESQGVITLTEVRVGSAPEKIILNIAEHHQIDLIILGTSIRAGSDRLYLGPRVERILNNAPCPVIVINS